MFKKIKQLLDWIYHRVCYFCGKSSQTGLMCEKCLEKIELNFPEPNRVIDNVIIYSATLYADDIVKLIRGVKYYGKKELAFYMAKILYDFWQKLEVSKEEFEIVPTPICTKRRKQRGYNQMELVAEEFSKLTGYSINTKIIERIKETGPQYKLKRVERMKNLKGAFKVNPEKYTGKKLLLMDDICSTGATLGEIIRTFKKNNIDDLCAIVGANPMSSS